MHPPKPIPYGIGSYKRIRQQNYYHVDKTRFIPRLETTGNYLLFCRPGRFGKSTLITCLECYYDMSRKHEYDLLFDQTFIKTHPTAEKHSHLILKFDFSMINPIPDAMVTSFSDHIQNRIHSFVRRYEKQIGHRYLDKMDRIHNALHKLEFVLDQVAVSGSRVYVFIDNYDKFIPPLRRGSHGELYEQFMGKGSSFRHFFSILKAMADQTDAGVARIFVTGMSPMPLFDISCDMDLIQDISLDPRFNELVGLTETEVDDMLEHYQPHALAGQNGGALKKVLQQWYGGYRFCPGAAQKLYHPAMVHYFIGHLINTGKFPHNMIDRNSRVDYDHLKPMLVSGKRLTQNFGYLTQWVEKNQIPPLPINQCFAIPPDDPQYFVAMLYHLGLLSHGQASTLKVPNQTGKRMIHDVIRDGFKEAGMFRLDDWKFGNLIQDMAYKGEWGPVFRLIAEEINQHANIKSRLTDKKKIISLLLYCLNASELYFPRPGLEVGTDEVDLFLEPFVLKYPEIGYSYLIELRYLNRDEFSEEKLNKLFAEAKGRLRKISAVKGLAEIGRGTTVKLVSMVFCGWEMKGAKEYGDKASSGPAVEKT